MQYRTPSVLVIIPDSRTTSMTRLVFHCNANFLHIAVVAEPDAKRTAASRVFLLLAKAHNPVVADTFLRDTYRSIPMGIWTRAATLALIGGCRLVVACIGNLSNDRSYTDAKNALAPNAPTYDHVTQPEFDCEDRYCQCGVSHLQFICHTTHPIRSWM